MRQANISHSPPLRLAGGAVLHIDGPPEGPPVLFLHGVGGGAWSWRPQVEALQRDWCCCVWEARGHGAAARVADAGLGDYYEDARDALDAVRARTRGGITVVGHSMGGLLALALAAESPHGIAALALIDPVYPDGTRASGHDLGPFAPFALALLAPLIRSAVRDGAVARALAYRVFAGSFTDKRRMAAAWREQRRQVPVEYPTMFREAFGRPERFPDRPFAESINVPVLLLNGRSAALAATLERRIGPRLQSERLPGGHYLQLDRPDDVSERLRTFLRERVGR